MNKSKDWWDGLIWGMALAVVVAFSATHCGVARADEMVDKIQCTDAPFYQLSDSRWKFNAQWRMLDYVTRVFYRDGAREPYEVLTFSKTQIYIRSEHWIVSTAYQWQTGRTTVALYSRRTKNTSVLYEYFTCNCDDYYNSYVDMCRSHL